MQHPGGTPDLLERIQALPSFQDLIRRLAPGQEVALSHVDPAAHACWITALHRALPNRPILVVCDTSKSQESLHSELVTWQQLTAAPSTPEAGKAAVQNLDAPLFFPEWEILAHEDKLPHADVVSERLETLVALQHQSSGADSSAPWIVTSIIGLLQLTFSATDLASRLRCYRPGDSINPRDLIEGLEAQGYEPEIQVSHKGELAWRGGIIDVWPLSRPYPVRIEFFGDDIESIREFDPHHQTSRETIGEILIPPAGELGLLRQSLKETAAQLPVPDADSAKDTVNSDSSLGSSSSGKTTGFESLLDHLSRWSEPPILVLSDTETLQDRAARYREELPVDDPFVLTWEQLITRSRLLRATWHELLLGVGDPLGSIDSASTPAPTGLEFLSLETHRPLGANLPETGVAETQRRDFFHQLHRWIRQGQFVQVICQTVGEQQRFRELWLEYGLPEPDCPLLQLGALARGFQVPDAKWVLVTDAEIYGRYKVPRARRLKSAHAQAVRSAFEVDFTAFEEGDYVVHIEHGIGVYRGLKPLPTTPTRGRPGLKEGTKECLVIEYAPSQPGIDPPRLFIPLNEAHLVGKYVGAGKARPQLSLLGTRRWTKAKEQAQRAVRDLAAELLSVQAARATQPGYAFTPDSAWQREFEAAFEYEETTDQLRAIEAVKQDLETSRPMDRLLCGDVGFGKTEVAIRAAFKAVMGGKQVAILVPTTVLAQQHYNTFRERMAEFPVRVELLSRFRTGKQQRDVLQAAREGAVDIVIGTHRLVSGDVEFRDLGLVIVDEEQRFGVKHKEEFKLLRQTVDVLTLSATPIPRTLYMALTGARDLSTLETPPQDRLPVETVVKDYDERLIRDAIHRELNRGGQVYFLHNRVATIESVALRIRDLVPEARVVVGHGQMEEKALEKVMTQFVNHEADVLVSTTIIESGLDIPNANTIIIDRADRFGLSELYQLRGRVGRYKHQAYAYLLLPRHARLLTEARKRMSAIRQYSALGSGFKIALRDLEIRGAGNILGPQQSGHITAVGFDLYCQLLAQSVAALKGEKIVPRIQVRTQLDFLATHPGEESAEAAPRPSRTPSIAPVHVPRDFDVYEFEDEESDRVSKVGRGPKSRQEHVEPPTTRAPAYFPTDYIREPSHRLELYRRLAQVQTNQDLEELRNEIRDRFGPVPDAVDLLLQVGELRLLAATRQVSSVEVTDNKVKLTRNGDLITIGGQFPRLKKPGARARLRELRQLIQALSA